MLFFNIKWYFYLAVQDKKAALRVAATLSGRTGSALAWRSEGRTFASQSVQ